MRYRQFHGAALGVGLAVLSLKPDAQELEGLPPAEDAVATPQTSLVRLEAIAVTDIQVTGSTVFSPEELDRLIAPYESGTLTLEQLHELRQAISAEYLLRGYVNSGVIIPDQSVENGVVVLQAIEGGLTGIDVSGNQRLRESVIARRVERELGSPLDVDELQESLQILRQDPLIDRVNAQLLPGQAPGESYLRLEVTERPPLELFFDASNHRAATVGEDRAAVGLTYRGLIGNGDALRGSFGITEGVDDRILSYSIPLNAGGTTFELSYVDQDSDIVEEPFDEIDIKSELETWSLTLAHPFRRGSTSSLTGIFGLEFKRSESSLLGMPFSFSPGDVDGTAKGRALSLGIEWTRRAASQAWVARGTLLRGVDLFRATKHPTDPDSEFTALRGQVQYMRLLPWRSSRLLARGAFQTSIDPLLAMYKLPVGGRFSVRGYRENLFVRDNGISASVEFQFPPFVDEAGRARGNLNLAVFADYGQSSDENDALPTSNKDSISSVGLGLLWDPLPDLHLELYWGHELDDQYGSTGSLQDRGVHYQLTFRRGF